MKHTRNHPARLIALCLALAVLTALAAPALGAAPPELYSQRAIVVDYDTGETYFEKNPDETGPAASMTKLMTAYLVYEDLAAGRFTMDTPVPITARAAAISADRSYSGVHTFQEGDAYPVKTLLRLALIPSCCASAIALGEFVSPDGTEAGCVARMNEKAAQWGIDAHFADCAGLVDEGNAVSPRAMAVLACNLLRDYPQVLEITSLTSVLFEDTWYNNTNGLLGTEECVGIDGLKSGSTTAAGKCYTGTALRDGRRVVSVSMDADTLNHRILDTRDLLNYGFACIAQAPDGLTAWPSVQTVTVDGRPVEFSMYALLDDQGYPTNYIRLRDLAAALQGTPARFAVGYDGGVSLTGGADYVPDGTEGATPFSGQRACVKPGQDTLVDGQAVALDAILLTDDSGGGYTYYKLRDLGKALGFSVDWSAQAGVSVTTPRVDYAAADSWAYWETETDGKAADVFFVCPTVYGGGAGAHTMPLDDAEARAAFLGATNMEKGIYDDNARFFAPYYRQVGLSVYTMPESQRGPWLEAAYADVKDAFSYYMEHENNGRGVVLAGFSQGGDLCLRLAEDFFGTDASGLIACYAIGWRVDEADLARCPGLSFASGEDDTGVVVSFNSESEDVTASLCIPDGARTLAVNPLNWKTDSTPADKSLNKGACFTDYGGNILNELPGLTGAYIDPVRGALKVPDVSPADYPPVLDIFEEGVYHLYDYQFFYRDLEANVQTRIDAWQNAGRRSAS